MRLLFLLFKTNLGHSYTIFQKSRTIDSVCMVFNEDKHNNDNCSVLGLQEIKK